MAKYATTTQKTTKPKSALTVVDVESVTHEGAPAKEKDAKTALFTLASTSATADDSFYETADQRDTRLRSLVATLTADDPEFIQKFVPWLRNTANMRSAPVVIAAEYALAGGPNKRQVIRSAMSRADEPAEFLGYWLARTGSRTLPGGVQRGLADAVRDLYNEYAALKYNSKNHHVRMADVIELAHPTPVAPWQGDLFKYLLDDRHHGDAVPTEALQMLTTRRALIATDESKRRKLVSTSEWDETARIAGLTWEFLSGWLPGGMDAEAWEAAIPQMGYMALLRNLRNFDEAGISDETVAKIKARLADPAQVAKSRQFPFRFWSAWNAVQSLHWGETLEKALELSVQNIPEFDGSTLVLIDVSASMTSHGWNSRSTVLPSDIAALFGSAVFAKNAKSTRVAVFGSSVKDVTPAQKGSMLRNMEVFRQNHGVGHGTDIRRALSLYNGEDRVVIFTDMQTLTTPSVPSIVHYFDLGGYSSVPDTEATDWFLYGGFTDSTFRQMALHETVRRSTWDEILG